MDGVCDMARIREEEEEVYLLLHYVIREGRRIETS